MELPGQTSTCIVTAPDVAVSGTIAAICVSLQLVTVSGAPFSNNVLSPCVAPNDVPVIVMAVPTGPLVGDKLDMTGGAI